MELGKSLTLNAFSKKSVLITGTTGFVGKVILEKMLRSVTSTGKIYLLIRGTSLHPSAYKRFLNDVASSSIFDSLKANDPEGFEALCRDKLRFVSGELTAPNFGLNDAEFTELSNKIDVVINSAASVNFREPLDDALKINALSLRTIINLTRVRKIPMVHVSTCYVNGYHQGLIPETVAGPARMAIRQTAEGFYDVAPLIAHLQQQVAAVHAHIDQPKAREQALINLGLAEAHRYGWNDTYTFTKWLGEQILMQGLQGQSLTIVRPSIVESTLSEPVPGWIEGVKVADAIILAYAREKVTFFPGNPNGIVDIIPADLVANSIILGAAEALLHPGAHRVYQCSSSHCNPVLIKDVIRHVQDEARDNHREYENLFIRKPQRPFVMVPGLLFNAGIRIGYFALSLKQRLLLKLGGKTSSIKLGNLETAMKLAVVFSFYTRPQYRFSNEALCAMAERMGEHDKAMFPVNAVALDWQHYFRKIHLSGLNCFSLASKTVKLKRVKREKQREAA